MEKYQLISDFNSQIANYLKVTDFTTQIANYLKISDFTTQIVKYQLITDFNTQIANYLKVTDFNTQIAKYQLITDFNTQIANYLKINDFNTQIAKYQLITDFNTQITNYLKTNDFNTQIANYLKTNDFNTQIANYLKNTDFNTQIANYLKISDFTTQIAKYLLTNPSQVTFLDQNYNITTSQISDFTNYMSNNYYNKQQVDQQIQINKQIVDLSNYYNKQQVDEQIQNNKPDLSNYYDTKTIDEKLTQYVPIPKRMNTQLDLYFQVLVGQIQDFIFQLELYLGTHNYVNEDNIDIYFKDYVKQKDLQNYLLTNDLSRQLQNYALIADLQNYVLTNDLNRQLQNYVLTTDFNSQLQKYAQITDLQKYVLTNDLTKQLQNYVLTSNLTTNYYTQQQVNDQLNNFLRVDDYNFFKQDYVKRYDYNQFIKNCLVVVPSIPIQLNQNYSISCGQISDLYANYYNQSQINGLMKQFNDYLRIIPGPQTQLNLNYQISTSQIWDLQNLLSKYVLQNDLLQQLNNFLLINPQNNTPINSYYTITTTQITDFQSYLNDNYYTGGFTDDQILKAVSNYLAITPSKQTALNSNYVIKTSQITYIANYYCNLNYINQQLANYVSISYMAQTLLSYVTNQQLNNYMIISPTNQTEINTNYTIVSTQITDFNNSVNKLIQNQTKNYLLTNPLSYYTLNANYQIQTANIPSQTINTSQIQNNTIQTSNLDSTLAPIFYSLYSCSQQETAVTTNQGQTKSYQANTPLGFYHYNKIYYNGTLMSNNQIYIGGSYYQFKTTNSMSLTGASSYINFDTSKQIYGADKGNQGAVGMFSALGPFNTFIGSTALGVNLTGNSTYSYPITFSVNNTNNSLISYINNTGAYTVNSDENLKHNLTEKQNHQEQLKKLLKLKILTYSYGEKYQSDIDDYKKQLQDSSISVEEKQIIQQKIEDLQMIQAKCILGFTYQDLDKNGFKYVLSDQQIMDDDYLDKQGIDKEKVKQKIQFDSLKTVQETALIPYTIMGIKALNENITNQDVKYQQIILDQQNQIVKINERIDTINNAMILSLSKIDEVSSQTDQKIQDVQQNSILNSINSDNIDDIKNTLNKLIYQFDQQQKVIKKYQSQIVFLQSQCEQLQTSVDKQQTDIINLKLKTKLVN